MPLGQETVIWIDVDGNEWDLNNPAGYFIEAPGLLGGFGIPMKLITHEVPGQPGDFEQYVQLSPNDIRAVLHIFAPGEGELEAARRALAEAMRPMRGVGRLRHVSSDGNVTRELFCREIGRFRDIAGRSPGHLKLGLQFRAADPFWYDTNYTDMVLTPGGTTTFFQGSFFPIHISAGGVSSGFTVENYGQGVAWPYWVITGPGTNPTLTNDTTGEELASNISLADSTQILMIDTHPGVSTVFREDGSNQWGTIASDSVLWALAEGVNHVTMSMGSTGAGSALQLRYKRRWEGY